MKIGSGLFQNTIGGEKVTMMLFVLKSYKYEKTLLTVKKG